MGLALSSTFSSISRSCFTIECFPYGPHHGHANQIYASAMGPQHFKQQLPTPQWHMHVKAHRCVAKIPSAEIPRGPDNPGDPARALD